MPDIAPKKKIAVLGGGVGALSAAFYLTEEPGFLDRHEITVFQQGWRLGGKCASGHDLREGYGQRIYEHGLHIFAGFYDRAFDLLERAYDALGRPEGHPNRTVWDAFTPQDDIALVDRDESGKALRIWYMDFPPNDERPGVGAATSSLEVMIQRMVALLLNSAPKPRRPDVSLAAGDGSDDLTGLLAWVAARLQEFKEKIETLFAGAVLEQIVAGVERHMRSVDARSWDPETRLEVDRFLLAAFLVQSILQGVVDDKVLQEGYDALDVYEWSEWLEKSARKVARRSRQWGDPEARVRRLMSWAPIASLYDYVFGYGDEGDTRVRSFAAGTALRSAMLMISYRGHFFWKMRGAMGDVVIAPLYLALHKRGVKFKFFSRIATLNVDPAAPLVESVDYFEQAPLADEARGYEPLISVPAPGWPRDNPLEGWPAEPLWEQLGAVDRNRDLEAEHGPDAAPGDLARTLVRGRDFDEIILGISVGGLKSVCRALPARLPGYKWGPMFGSLTLTPTCAMQLWFTRTMDDLGCQGPDRTLTGADQPYSSWSDMTHLLARETWDGAERPRSVAYFCGQIRSEGSVAASNVAAMQAAKAWLKANAPLYFSQAQSPASAYGLDPLVLHDPAPGAGGDPLERQFVRANINPSDLYVQSPKGSVFNRMDADQSGLDNLFLAGDWTRNGLNSGCAEAAARSGWRCAQAVLGMLPALDD